MSGDVLSQQTHRRALVGGPWQLAAAGTWKGMPGPGCQPPPGLQGPSSAPPVPRVEVWKRSSQGPMPAGRDLRVRDPHTGKGPGHSGEPVAQPSLEVAGAIVQVPRGSSRPHCGKPRKHSRRDFTS